MPRGVFYHEKNEIRDETAYIFCKTEIVKDCDMTMEVRTEVTERQLPPNFL